MGKDRQVTFVRSRAEIVEMMEKLYGLMFHSELDPARIIVMTDTLEWVISDSNYLEELINNYTKEEENAENYSK